MKKIQKGKIGYLKNRKTILFLRLSLVAIVIIGFLIGSKLTEDTMKKILTVMAILAVLPLANIGTVFIAMMPFVGKTHEENEAVRQICTNELLEFELVITSSSDPTVYFPYLSIYKDQVIALAEGEKVDGKRAASYLMQMLEGNGIDTKVIVYEDLQEFIKKLQELEPCAVKRESCSNKLLRTEGVLLALSM